MNKVEEFQAAIIEGVYLPVLRECGYNARTFLEMIASSGGVGAAKSLLQGSAQSGFRGLRRMGRTDLTVEHLVIQPQWRSLFTRHEIDAAIERLRRMGKGRPTKKAHQCGATDCPLRT